MGVLAGGMADDHPSTIGISVNDRDWQRTVEPFDEFFDELRDSYSRSEEVKRAMHCWVALHEILADMDDVEPGNYREEIHYFRQGIVELRNRERNEASVD